MNQETVKIVGVIVVGVLAAIMILFEILDNLRREREKDRAHDAELEAQGIDPKSIPNPIVSQLRQGPRATIRETIQWIRDHSETSDPPPEQPEAPPKAPRKP